MKKLVIAFVVGVVVGIAVARFVLPMVGVAF